ncbi:hypothetical protein KUTeg_020670 [Tegillarca granosa]|uniref:Uncharacterized protein n=1 Tax=Tegillarca granosa TaxID=220873 RepID=A0ABQ9E8M2_TEGGR|nr:hypothetical protein KUTeg_020670 [Tegillarca granosa]
MAQLRWFIVIFVFTSFSYFVHAQVVNLAFNKSTNSTVLGEYSSSLAADGNLSQEWGKCARTKFQPKQTVAWWQVDLAVIAEIKEHRKAKGKDNVSTTQDKPDDDSDHGLTRGPEYIATQEPMKNTVEDFRRMVWQTKSSIIVMLSNVIEDRAVTCFQYWPGSSSVLACLDYEIIPLEEKQRTEFITRKLKTCEIREVCHLQIMSWPRQGNPIPYQLLLLHRQFAEISSTNNSTPAIIHCSDDTDRTGVFIAFDAISQCCYRNETIDICMFVKEMRQKRINMIATEDLIWHPTDENKLGFNMKIKIKHEFSDSESL